MSALKSFFAPVDMTEGSPVRKILTFALPMLLGNIANQLYSTVDSIVVGRYVGDNALAAVGSSMPIINLLFVLFFGVSSGVSVVVAQFVGARNREKLSEAIGMGLFLGIVVAVLMAIIGPLVSRPILELLNTPEAIIDWCEKYLLILFSGYIGSIFYFMISGMLRGMGDSFSALLYLLIACVLNIGLDIWFVAGLKMEGVSGVAYATIIAQFISALFCLNKLRRLKNLFDLKWRYLKPNGPMIKEILRLGLPTGLTQMIMSLCMVIVQNLTNSFGETVIATNVIVMRIDSFAMMPNMTFSVAMTTYVGQNLGAGNYERIHDGVKKGVRLAVGISIFMVGLLLILSKILIVLFTETPEIIDMGIGIIRFMAIGYVATAVTQSLMGSMRGAGNTISPMWISILTSVVVRVPLAYLIRNLTISEALPKGNYMCLFISMLLSWILGAVITAWIYLKGKWRKVIDVDRTPEPEIAA
ncbi:MAG: MATE family efflux transporter [Lachnospiraceae bacterium]|nr:MATE family efflux transporter [Lachnospiraceae bacterium]